MYMLFLTKYTEDICFWNLIFMNYKQAIQNPIFSVISEAARDLNVESYVIGGFVRDFILERGTPKDIDVVAVGAA